MSPANGSVVADLLEDIYRYLFEESYTFIDWDVNCPVNIVANKRNGSESFYHFGDMPLGNGDTSQPKWGREEKVVQGDWS